MAIPLAQLGGRALHSADDDSVEAEYDRLRDLRSDQARGQTHLHAMVGKGNRSAGHVQKIKPKVEGVCRELGLKYRMEENAGILINLQGGEPMPPQQQHCGGGQYHGEPAGPPGAPPHSQGGQHGNQNQEDIAQLVEKALPRILHKLEKACCNVM